MGRRARQHPACCGIFGCDEKYYAKDMCKAHYMHQLREGYKAAGGSPKQVNAPRPFDMDDFWEFVKKELQLQ